MKKNIFNYEGEEKEISLSSVKEMESSNSDNNMQMNIKKKNVKFEKSKTSYLKNSFSGEKVSEEKDSKEKDSEKYSDKEEENQNDNFKRRKNKFNTLLPKKLKFFESTFRKKKRGKKKGQTVKGVKNLKPIKEKKEKEKNNEKNADGEEDESEENIEEFEDKEIKTKLEIVLEKKFTPTQTMLSYCKCQLFISYENMTGFEYTGLEGILCVVINRLLSNLYLQIYDIMDFKKQFEIEIYTNIFLNKGYEVMTPKFHSIEFPTFCLGLNFYTIKKANEIKDIILNFSKALNSSLFYQYEKKNHDTFKQKKLFDYISDPKKVVLSYNDKRKKTFKEMNYQLEYNNNNNLNNENESNYLEQMFGTYNKKLNYKISSNEQMLSFSIDQEANEVTFDTSKGANRFLEQNNIEISDINEEYEKMKEQVKSKIKNNKLVTNKTKKSIQEEIKDKENKEKIKEIINQIEGLQEKDKNIFNFEEGKEKLNNKIKKFNVTKRLPLNQKMQITSPPENLVFYGEESDSFEEVEDDEEEEEEEEDDDDNNNNEKIIKDLFKNNKFDINEVNNILNINSNEKNENENKKSMKLHLSSIGNKASNNSSEIMSNSIKNEENKNVSPFLFSSKNSSIKGKSVNSK